MAAIEYNHMPVLLNECIRGLMIRPDGVYVDGTLGGGGHSLEILKRLTTGRLIGIDRDEAAILAARARIALSGARFQAVRANFHDIDDILAQFNITSIDGALIDLGVSSHQLDSPERGFSYHEDAPLDMRMDLNQELSARKVVNLWPEADIARALTEYGEERWAKRIARFIVERRARAPIETTGQLVSVIDAAIPKSVRHKDASHPARRTFQAIRIAVNDELKPLEAALRAFAHRLKPGGRLCVIAFHSLEDRIVKNTFASLARPCTCPADFPVCVCGKVPRVRVITRKPITASAEELETNPRARSATLRISEGLDV